MVAREAKTLPAEPLDLFVESTSCDIDQCSVTVVITARRTGIVVVKVITAV